MTLKNDMILIVWDSTIGSASLALRKTPEKQMATREFQAMPVNGKKTCPKGCLPTSRGSGMEMTMTRKYVIFERGKEENSIRRGQA